MDFNVLRRYENFKFGLFGLVLVLSTMLIVSADAAPKKGNKAPASSKLIPSKDAQVIKTGKALEKINEQLSLARSDVIKARGALSRIMAEARASAIASAPGKSRELLEAEANYAAKKEELETLAKQLLSRTQNQAIRAIRDQLDDKEYELRTLDPDADTKKKIALNDKVLSLRKEIKALAHKSLLENEEYKTLYMELQELEEALMQARRANASERQAQAESARASMSSNGAFQSAKADVDNNVQKVAEIYKKQMAAKKEYSHAIEVATAKYKAARIKEIEAENKKGGGKKKKKKKKKKK